MNQQKLGPWQVSEAHPTIILDNDGWVMAVCSYYEDELGRNSAENAAFVVKACNTHEELVFALRLLLAVVDDTSVFDADEARCIARIALAKVTP
jgi:hypothetical protein